MSLSVLHVRAVLRSGRGGAHAVASLCDALSEAGVASHVLAGCGAEAPVSAVPTTVVLSGSYGAPPSARR